MDGSQRSSHGNAYFTGFGAPSASCSSTRCCRGSRRTRSKRCSRTNSATSSCHHVWKRITLLLAASFALLWVLGTADRPAEMDSNAAAGVALQSTATALLLFVLVTAGVHFFPAAADRSRCLPAATSSRPTPTPPRCRRLRAWSQALVKLYQRQRLDADAGSAATRRSTTRIHRPRCVFPQAEDHMNDLVERRCKPCEGGTIPYDAQQTKDMLKQLRGWIVEDGKLVKLYPFKNYYETMAFVNALAWVSHREDHHPDLLVGYNKCRRWNIQTRVHRRPVGERLHLRRQIGRAVPSVMKRVFASHNLVLTHHSRNLLEAEGIETRRCGAKCCPRRWESCLPPNASRNSGCCATGTRRGRRKCCAGRRSADRTGIAAVAAKPRGRSSRSAGNAFFRT